jgi:hypothetical protein
MTDKPKQLRDDGYRVWDGDVCVFEYKHSDHPRAAEIVKQLLACADELRSLHLQNENLQNEMADLRAALKSSDKLVDTLMTSGGELWKLVDIVLDQRPMFAYETAEALRAKYKGEA